MAIVEKERVEEIVVGWPRDMSGVETEQTKLVDDFVIELEHALSAKVHKQDEALTSVRARELLDEQHKSYTKEEIDMWSAVIIGRDYMEQMA